MNKLLSTTALVVALGCPTLMVAQTAAPAAETAETAATEQDAGQQDTNMSDFLTERGQSDLFASELIGHEVHTRSTADEAGATSDPATSDTDGTDDIAMMNRADLDGMDNIGQINEIVLSADGQVRALVIGVGGFLGMGEQDVAVTMDQISIMPDADDPSEIHVVLNAASDMLKEAPAYDRMSATSGAEMNGAAAGSDGTDRAAAGTDAGAAGDATGVEDRTAFAAPEMEREGYQRVEVEDVSTDMLLDRTVYDVNDEDVGEVQDMLLDGDGQITNVIIDFGGFLGIGSSQASLEYEELTIMSNEGYRDVRIYVDATREQIQDLPRYLASN